MSTASSSSAAQTAGIADVIDTGRTTAAPTQDRLADPSRRRWPRTLGSVIIWVLLIGFSLLFLYPLVWLLAASFKPRGEVFDNRLIPETFSPQNYVQVWDELPLLSWALNSIVIAVLAAGLVVLSSALVAFGFAYFRFPAPQPALRAGAGHDDAARGGDDGAAVSDLAEAGPGRHLGAVVRGQPVRLGLLHLPAAAVLPRATSRAVRGCQGGRGELLRDVPQDRPAAVDAVAGDHLLVRVPGQLEQPPGRA